MRAVIDAVQYLREQRGVGFVGNAWQERIVCGDDKSYSITVFEEQAVSKYSKEKQPFQTKVENRPPCDPPLDYGDAKSVMRCQS